MTQEPVAARAERLLQDVQSILAEVHIPVYFVEVETETENQQRRANRGEVDPALIAAIERIDREDWEVRREFVLLESEGETGLGGTTALALLQLMVENDTEWSVRERAVERIGRMGGPEARAVLQKALDTDPHPAPQEAARRSLAALAEMGQAAP